MNLVQGFELKDLLLVPKLSCVNSRNDVDLSVTIGNLTLSVPIITAPMSGIVGLDLIIELDKLGGLGILHRFYNDPLARVDDVEILCRRTANFGVAVGLNDDFYKFAVENNAAVICIDVANGYLDSVKHFTNQIATFIGKYNYSCLVMAGNVATNEGAELLNSAGATLIRVGIGSGGLCTTRKNTGIGVPQATAIRECCKSGGWIVADGGIKNSGDAVKALALGANFVMIGSLLARCFESQNNGKITGMASREFQEQFYGEVKKSVEGIQKEVVRDISLSKLITEFCWNMKSAFTYTNSRNIFELHKNAEFILTGTESIK